MSKRKGRTYELQMKRNLEALGWHVIDVASNAGLTGTFDADLLVWPPGHTPAEGWQQRKDPHMLEMEVKFRKDAAGFSGLYDAHLEICGLGGQDSIWWEDDICTGGIWALEHHIRFREFTWEQTEPALTAFTRAAFKPGVDVVACRAPRKPWVLLWKREVGR